MFRRSEKKIKVVFRMQFHATQVPEMKSKKLVVSLVPVDDGKPTTRLPKAPILEGVCIWEKPVYETVKLVQETKTGFIREKFYYIVVSTGSSKSGFLGEVSIDFADLVNAVKPVNLSLPLQTSKSGTILHVTVQRVNGEGSSTRWGCDDVGEATGEDEVSGHWNTDSGRYSQGTRQKDPMSPESYEFSGETPLNDDQEGSMGDAESDNSEPETRNGMKETSLRNEVKMLERKLEVSELEMESLRKQMMKEMRNVEQLTAQIVRLKQEKGALEAECERLRPFRTWDDGIVSGKKQEIDDIKATLESTQRELQNQKLSSKRLKLQLQEIEDSNCEYVLAIEDLTKKLDQKEAEISDLSNKIMALQSGSLSKKIDLQEDRRILRDVEKYDRTAEEAESLQNMEKLKAEIELLKKEKANIRKEAENLTEDYESLETENKELYFKLDQMEREKMDVEKSCKELSSEVKHFKVRVANLEAENERQLLQYTEALNMINQLEVQVETLREELKKQEQLAEQDLETLRSENVELGKRAVTAEEALRKTRRTNADTIQKLKEEFLQLDAENSMRFEEYEKLTNQANAEASNTRKENEILQQLLQEADKELQILRSQYEANHNEHGRLHEGAAESNKELVIAEDGAHHVNESVETKNELEMLQRLTLQKEDLERQLTSIRKEADKLTEENASMKFQINQKKAKEENLHLEVRKLRLKNSEVKNQLLDLKSEKEDLKKEISKLRDDLSKKEQMPMEPEQPVGIPSTEYMKSQDLTTTRESSVNNSISSGEVESLKEQNSRMEQELKDMRERYSEISLKFAEVEGERQQLVMSLRNLKGPKKN